MQTLITYLGSAAIGYFIASRLRSKKEQFSWTGRLLAAIVTSLVFSMGLKIGGNEEVVNNLGQVGLYGLAFCLVPLAATIGALYLTRKLMGYNHEGKRRLRSVGHGTAGPEERAASAFQPETAASASEGSPEASSEGAAGKNGFLRSSSFRYLVAVLLGLALGYFGVIRGSLVQYDALNAVLGIYITWALRLMVFLVGLDMGFDGNIIGVFREIGWRVAVFPVVIGLATVAAGLLLGFFTPLSLTETLAVTCTFCWYSLAPNIIMNAGYVTAGAIAFLANFLRVLLSLITIPLVAKKVGWLETVGMPIAASMDVCIGTITEATDKETALYAFASGVVYTILIPLLVPIIVGA